MLRVGRSHVNVHHIIILRHPCLCFYCPIIIGEESPFIVLDVIDMRNVIADVAPTISEYGIKAIVFHLHNAKCQLSWTVRTHLFHALGELFVDGL